MHLPWASPFQLQLSFDEPIRTIEAAADKGDIAAQQLLQEVNACPELRNGITDTAGIEKNAELIARLLQDYFPKALTLNEIKAVSIPYTNILFNHTERFKNLLAAAGTDFDINIRDMDEPLFYVRSCCIILNEFYGTNLDFNQPIFCDIPTKNGIVKHYRILYNADFIDIMPTDKMVPLSEADVDLLINNFDNVELWKEKFPVQSWILKGFALLILYDATVENALSLLKEKLLGITAEGFSDSVAEIARSIFLIPDLHVGFTSFQAETGTFGPDPFGQQLTSFLLPEKEKEVRDLLCPGSYCSLIEQKTYFAVADTLQYQQMVPDNYLPAHMLAKGIRSFILAPVMKNGNLFGILEIVSYKPKELNSINATKLDMLMPFLQDTTERLSAELQNQIQAVIQEEYTTIHNSVYWKFLAEAQKVIAARQLGKAYVPREVVFADVYPLYGQVDIKGSSEARNNSVQLDLRQQLKTLLFIFRTMNEQQLVLSSHDIEQQLEQYLNELILPLKASTEQYITNFLNRKVHPRLRQITAPAIQPAINDYFREDYHTHRRKYETTIAMINETLADVIDKKQVVAQNIIHHYFERFKTDGVEHNIYVGASISPSQQYDHQKLSALRLWQLRVICEMEKAHARLKPVLPYPLDVTSLILAYPITIDIRFRMDEKRFDIDGTYNIRFEIVKKRIDKAYIKDSLERITEPGKLTIVYSNDVEEQEYRRYIKTLQEEKLLQDKVEKYEVEDLQGVSGLKILRVAIS